MEKKGKPENLKPVRTKEEARERGRQGGIKSGIARNEAKTAKEILGILNDLPASGNNKDKMAMLGIPDELQTQKTMRIVALHQKALTGDAQAQRLVLEIEGEAPSQKLDVEVKGNEAQAELREYMTLLKQGGKQVESVSNNLDAENESRPKG
jgi:hypothetical protein